MRSLSQKGAFLFDKFFEKVPKERHFGRSVSKKGCGVENDVQYEDPCALKGEDKNENNCFFFNA
jgi:hypothetical protein